METAYSEFHWFIYKALIISCIAIGSVHECIKPGHDNGTQLCFQTCPVATGIQVETTYATRLLYLFFP